MSQNWTEVSWDKRGQRDKNLTKEQNLNKAKRTGNVVTSKKYGSTNTNNTGGTLNTKTLDDDHESTHHVKISNTLKKVLQQARMKAKMSQKELATAINVKPTVIQAYEAGKGIPNSQILLKMERALRQKNPELAPGTLTKAQKK
jgi:putative transcription factor